MRPQPERPLTTGAILRLAAAKVVMALGRGRGGKEESQKSPAARKRKRPKVPASTKRNRQHMVGFSLCRALIYSLPGCILFQLLKERVWCKPPDNLLSWSSVDVSSSLLNPVFGPANIPC